MEWNQETLQFLSQCFLHTLSPSPEPRRLAESKLSEASERPNYGIALLRLVAEPSIEEQIRQAAAVNFKNHVRRRWVRARPASDSDETVSEAILEPEKELIKSLIVPLMLSSSPRILPQLSDALSIIGKHDFPKLWPALLPELVSGLQKASDYASINGILSTANSIFKKFRFAYKTNDLLLDLKYCLDNFSAPLLETFLRSAALVDSATSGAVPDARFLRALFESQRLCCRIFFSLNFQDLPEFFEDHMKEWMGEFKKYLSTEYPTAAADGGGPPRPSSSSVVDELRAAVCENITLYAEKDEEAFEAYLSDFALAVWSLLTRSSSVSSQESVTIRAFKFLTTVSVSVRHSLFGGEGSIERMFESIVAPNVQVRSEDEELFETNYVEFIRRDVEGSDKETRRRSACQLMKSLRTYYRGEVTRIVSSEIQKRLASYSANPSENWRDKESSIYYIVSFAERRPVVSTDLVDLPGFMASAIGPELGSEDVNAVPMLKAGVLKFLTVFRRQITKPAAVSFFPGVMRLLRSESNVVHSYASVLIEKLLTAATFSEAEMAPLLLPLMSGLFGALKFPESEENPYVMRCMMRVIGCADIPADVAGHCMSGLTSVLSEVCRNPKTPDFNHYLFESVAGLVRRACGRDPSLVPAFEASVFPSLQAILANDVAEFFPYAFQLLAQLVELNAVPGGSYAQVFELLLSPQSWKRKADVPALVRLLRTFLRKGMNARVGEVLGIFRMLVEGPPSTARDGFHVLNAVVETVSAEAIAPYASRIWITVFARLQARSGDLRLVGCVLVLMALFVVKHGALSLVASMDAVQAGICATIVGRFWTPDKVRAAVAGPLEVKLLAVASVRLLTECPDTLDGPTWGKLLASAVALAAPHPTALLPVVEEDHDDDDDRVLPHLGDYSTTFIPLHNAGQKEDDPLPDIENPDGAYVVSALAHLSSRSPGKFSKLIQDHLDPSSQTHLHRLCALHNLLIL